MHRRRGKARTRARLPPTSAVAAIAALAAFQKWEEWVNAALGAWLIVSPFILGFGSVTAALWNQLIVGVR
jgi:hypothetical protein